jgi:hypothetical protein
MIETKQLKLNVNNIKSTLIRGNKNLKKIRIQEKTLLLKQKKEQQKIQKENFVEGKKSQSSKIGNAAKAIAAPVMGFFDKIKEFLSLVLLGFAVNNAPRLIKGIEKFIEDNQWISKIFEVFFKSIEFIVPTFKNIVNFFNPSKRAEMEKNRSELTDSIDKLLGLNKNIEKDLKSVESDLDKALKFQPKSSEEVRNDVAYAIKKQEISRIDFVEAGKSLIQAKMSKEPTQRVVIPGIGSYQKVKTGGLFGIGSTLAVKTTDTSGTEIPTEEFINRYESISGSNFASVVEKLRDAGVEGYSKGGTASSSPESPTAKKAKIGVKSFSDAKNNANNQSMIIETQQKNNESFKELVKNFTELNKNDKDKKDNPTTTTPSTTTTPPTTTQSTTQNGSYASGTYIGPAGDPDGEQTGLNMNLPGGIGTPIYAPVDMVYKTTGTDGNPAVGLQGTSNVLGPAGSGFGYYGAYFFEKDGKQHEVVMGHFRDLPYKGTADGEKIPKGTLLGYQGASGRSVSNTNGVYPHISLHVNGIGFMAGNATLKWFANGLATGTAKSTSSSAGSTNTHQGPVITGAGNGGNRNMSSFQFSSGKGDGLRRSEQLTQTFDGEGMTDVIIINNTQPIIIPGPTRYIRR